MSSPRAFDRNYVQAFLIWWDSSFKKYRKEIGVGLVYSITILNNLNSDCGLLFVSYIIIFCSAFLVFGFKC